MRSGSYLEVYSNLYYLIAQDEETSATDKFAGFILNKEGAEFVEQNANLFKYDLLYNPLHFKSWQKLANIYDEEVDLLLNDGSKHINNLDWGKNTSLLQRVEKSRRRSRRCLLMSLALARTPLQQSQIHELLGLVYHDSVQNVVPLYDRRAVTPTKDEAWLKFCQNSLKHFEKAFTLGPDWVHAFYLGKLCEKMGYSSAKAFSYYNKAILLNPSAVYPFYRLHASRLKLLYSGKWDADSLKICALYCFSASKKQSVCDILGWTDNDLQQSPVGLKDAANDSFERNTPPELHKLDEVWHLLYDDCLSALAICTEGELKHYHKARYVLALGYYRRNEKGDLELAKDELSFCFRSTRSPFTINMWEIDGMVKKGKRKTQSLSGNRRVLEEILGMSWRYRSSGSCGTFPSGIKLYTMLLSPHFVVEDPLQLSKNGIENLDLRIPRKLLLWAYTLVHGQYSNILVVVKHCEENVKSKLKRGTASTTSPQSAASPLAHMGCGKDRNTPEDRGIKENSTDLHSITNETPKLAVAASELQSCGPESEITRSGHNTTTDTSEL